MTQRVHNEYHQHASYRLHVPRREREGKGQAGEARTKRMEPGGAGGGQRRVVGVVGQVVADGHPAPRKRLNFISQ